MKPEKTIQTSRIQEFADLVSAGIEAWEKAGQVVVELLDADPDAINKICEVCQYITPDIVFRFEQIGRKHISPKLLLSDTPGTRKLITLPFSVQEKYAEEPIELLVMNDGKADTLKVSVKNMTGGQASQAFSSTSVRTIAEQRAYIFDKQSKATFPKLADLAPYKIKGDVVQFREGCTLTARDLSEILSRIA